MIFYEAPHKLSGTLQDLLEFFGPDRRISLCRELTKLHEEVWRTTLGEAADWYNQNSPKGEFVLVLEGVSLQREDSPNMEDALAQVSRLKDSGRSLKDATRQVSAQTGISRNTLYECFLRNNM